MKKYFLCENDYHPLPKEMVDFLVKRGWKVLTDYCTLHLNFKNTNYKKERNVNYITYFSPCEKCHENKKEGEYVFLDDEDSLKFRSNKDIIEYIEKNKNCGFVVVKIPDNVNVHIEHGQEYGEWISEDHWDWYLYGKKFRTDRKKRRTSKK